MKRTACFTNESARVPRARTNRFRHFWRLEGREERERGRKMGQEKESAKLQTVQKVSRCRAKIRLLLFLQTRMLDPQDSNTSIPFPFFFSLSLYL